MNDSAIQLLYQVLAQNHSPALWVLDEHGGTDIPSGFQQLHCLSNRLDSAKALEAAGYECGLSDFNFAALPAFEQFFYRVSKEKALVHYVLNQAMERLPIGGGIHLFGYKNEGLKTYAKKVAEALGDGLTIEKGEGNALHAVLTKRTEPSALLPDQNYCELQPLARKEQATLPDGVELHSKPGIFGWQKIDKGSQLLVTQLADFYAGFRSPPETVLDLGCGYGYLSALSRSYCRAKHIATDNSVTALIACAKNLSAEECHLADAGDSLPKNCADAILCNPPFHSGFDHDKSLTLKFLTATKRLLRGDGRALFVVNQHIGLEQTAVKVGLSSKVVVVDRGFKVVLLTHAK